MIFTKLINTRLEEFTLFTSLTLLRKRWKSPIFNYTEIKISDITYIYTQF